MLTDQATFQCPYCWELGSTDVWSEAVGSTFVEDCHVCCRPILLSISESNEGEFFVTAERENG